MESLSRPFHSRKLSNTYDAVFSGHRPNYTNKPSPSPSPIDVQDYIDIFTTSQNSSIPILDLSSIAQPSDSFTFNFRNSKPDYSIIFGGYRHQDVSVSYEQVFGGSDKTRAPSSTTQNSQDLDNLSHQSPDALKRFNMSYNKTNPKSKDGLDGTEPVTQVPAVTGFTCFVDEPVIEGEKLNLSSAVNVKSSRNAVRKESNYVESSCDDRNSRTFDIDFKMRPRKDDQKRSINLEPSKPDIDVNSAASASSAALKKAIEKAQESIRIAKESVGRKKNGLRSFSNKKFQKSLKLEGEEQKCRDEEDSSQIFHDVGRNRKYGGPGVLPNFMESEKLFVAKKFIDEIHEKISESVKDSKFGDDTVAYNETESKPLDSAGKDESATLCSEAVDTESSKIQISDFVHEYQTDNKIVDEYEAGIEVSKPILEHQTVVKELESEENDSEVSQDFDQNDNENRLDASLELLENEKQENVLEQEEVEYAESEKHEEILEASEWVKSENESKHDQNSDKQDNVLEHEDSENAESGKHEEQEHEEVKYAESKKLENRLDASMELLENEKQEHEEVKYAESVKLEEIEEASDMVESGNESEHDRNSEIHNDEETSEMLDGFCEIDAKDSVQICDNKFEESEDCETKQEDDHVVEREGESLDESCDQEFDEKSSSDNNIMEQTDDINVETTQDIDDVTEVSCEFQAEEADFCEKTSVDQTASDDNEDEYEVKSEEDNIIDNLTDLGLDNDVQSESSSGSTHGVKIIEESNIQPARNETPDTESTNEIKDSQEPKSRDKEDEVEESGPSKVSEKTRFNKIDEEAAAKRREWEKNRLAVDRAVREARERAFAEARERAERERAAVEKATEEVRQRMMAEAHEKVSKASVEKTSAQSKLKAERAAVERATSEARQRALEKAISQKTASDLNRSESALRTKAKLEKHNRIMERVAKALAEKEKRDRLAQKEQAERNRLAENFDADIKRWSKGKEGNLRALLSTLQYILGPESGWQPVSLTEIITASAVKKAYRKATLCVHPDKLQQRGATIQQKYICEKVFDLLKAAWSRFNSEER